MHNTVLYGLWVVVSFLIFQAINYISRRRSRALKSRQLGCQPAPVWDSKDILGIKNARKMVASADANRMPVYLIERFEEISKREGRTVSTMEQAIAASTQMTTSDPKNIQALLATQFKDFGLGEKRIANFSTLLGYGIFSSDGKMWEHSRALLRPQFARELVSNLELEEEHVQHMMQALPVTSTGWTEETDIQKLFFRLTLDSATEFLFGESVGSQLANLPGATATAVDPARDEKAFAHAFDKGQYTLGLGARLGDFYWLAHTKEFKQHCKQVHSFVDHFVQLALSRTQQANEKAGSDSPGKKEKYVFLHALAAETRDPIELRAQILNILLAGRDTTASMLSWLMLLLTQHPAIYKKLRAAIIEDFGTYTQPRDITFARLKNCTYLQHTLSEVLRLFPLVPLNSRRALVDTTIPRGGGPDGLAPVFVPKGREVQYSVHAMQRRTDLWGADANAFVPERWEKRRPGWDYLPFNGGPRICIGQQFALTEGSYVVVRLLQRFGELRGVGDLDVLHGLTLTNCPAEGVTVRLREAAE